MVQSPSWKANRFAASQEIPRISRNPKVHYLTHKRPPTLSILGQPNPVHIPKSHLLKIHPNIIHPSTPRSPQCSPSLRFPHHVSHVLSLVLSCLVCNCCLFGRVYCCSRLVCIVVILCVYVLLCVYCCFCTLDAGLLARSQYSKVLRPATSTQVFLGFPVSISKCWDGSQNSKLPLHASHVALPTET